jgi:hypothetical protein
MAFSLVSSERTGKTVSDPAALFSVQVHETAGDRLCKHDIAGIAHATSGQFRTGQIRPCGQSAGAMTLRQMSSTPNAGFVV